MVRETAPFVHYPLHMCCLIFGQVEKCCIKSEIGFLFLFCIFNIFALFVVNEKKWPHVRETRGGGGE